MMVMIVYYAGLGVFWLGFWIGLAKCSAALPERMSELHERILG
jgi:hypothetical protein